jgi:hypothetical protein
VAWSGLQLPAPRVTTTNPSAPKIPNMPKGINLDLLKKAFQGHAQAAVSVGYDPAKDFRKHSRTPLAIYFLLGYLLLRFTYKHIHKMSRSLTRETARGDAVSGDY